MNLKTITLLGLCAFCLCASAQKQANNWLFGFNAGISWNTGVPVPFTGGQTQCDEGVGSISDGNGNLLFYTDGNTVWDRTNTPMPNGTGLLGNTSTSEDGLIVPYPNSLNLYYVFSLDASGGSNGLTYSIVDMTLNGGLGDVTGTKNVLLYTPSTEKVCAAKAANGVDVWLASHQDATDSFVLYLITPTGINPTPIIQAAGTVTPFGDEIGYMNFSPNGSMVCLWRL